MRRIYKKCLSVLLSFAMLFSFLPLRNIAFASDIVYVDRKADAVFVIDATGSMGSCIESVKTNLSEFIRLLDEDGVDVRTRFVVFRDITCSEKTETSSWFTDTDSAVTYLQNISATGGGDGPETPFDGIGQMFSPGFGFRSDTAKFCILLTDADYKLDNYRGISSVDEVVTRLRAEDINTSVIASPSDFSLYKPLVSPGHAVTGEDKGILANIYGDYSILLMNFASTIINSVKTAVVERMEPYFGEVGISHSVKVIASNLSYADDFAVTFDGKPVEVLTKEATYFTFNTPADKPVGSYPVEITNGGGLKSSAGYFMVLASPADDAPFIYGATPYKFEEGKDTTVSVSGRNFINPTVYLGDMEMTITSFTDTAITFRTGDETPAGRYQLKVVNDNGKYAVAPEYFNIYYGEMSEPHTITSVSPSSFDEHTEQEITITGTKFVSPTVTLGGKELEVLSSTSTQITCKVDTSFSDGSYDLTVTCRGKSITLYGAIYLRAIMLKTPIITDITAEDGFFRINWTAEEGEYFEVYRSTSSSGSKTYLGTTKDMTYKDTTAALGKEYYYYVKAFAPLCGDTIESNFSPAYKFGIEVGVPVITSAVFDEDLMSVVLDWDDAKNADTYEIYRAYSSTGAKILVGTTGESTFADATAKPGKKYYYFVKGKNCTLGIESEMSKYYSILIGIPELEKPLITDCVFDEETKSVTVRWNSIEDAEEYEVYRSMASSTGAKTLIGKTSETSFCDNTVLNGKKYYYFVKAKNIKYEVESDFSTFASIIIPAAPPVAVEKPTIESVTAADGKVTVKVVEYTGAEKYEIYRANGSTGAKTKVGTITAPALTFEDSTVTADKKYYYFMKAIVGDKTTAFSAYASVKVPAAVPPTAAKPTIESVTAADGKVTVKVTEYTGAESYEIYRAASSTGAKTKVGTITAPALTLEDSTVTAGKRYYYFMKAIVGDKATAFSAYVSVVVPAAPPVAVEKPTIESVTAVDGKVTVKVVEYTGAEKYEIYRANGSTGAKIKVGTITAPALTFEDSTVTADKKYYYFMKAIVGDKATAFSAYASVKVPAAVPPTAAKPTIESVTAADGKVTVKVTEYTGAESYEIYRAASSTGAKTKVGTITAPALTLEDSTVTADKKYYYFMKAVVGGKATEFSTYVSVVVPAAPPVAVEKPTIESVTAAGGKVTVKVTEYTGADSYEIYRASSSTGAKRKVGTITAPALTFEDSTVTADKKYYYFMKAIVGDKATAFSAYASVKVPAAVPPTAAKPVIESLTTADGKVMMTVAEYTGADSYEIYRAASSTGAKRKVGTITAPDLTLEDSTVATGKKYYYFMKAIVGGETSSFSGYKSIVVI